MPVDCRSLCDVLTLDLLPRVAKGTCPRITYPRPFEPALLCKSTVGLLEEYPGGSTYLALTLKSGGRTCEDGRAVWICTFEGHTKCVDANGMMVPPWPYLLSRLGLQFREFNRGCRNSKLDLVSM